MFIEAVLTEQDCADFLASLTPLKVDLGGPDRCLVIERPSKVEIVPDEGLRLQAAGHVTWTVVGVKVPINARIASLMLSPTVEKRDDRDALCFRARIEQLDVKALPSFVDSSVVKHINRALADQDEVLVWRFGEKLNFHIAAPKRIESANTVHARQKAGTMKITADAIVFALTVEMRAVADTAHAAE